MAGVYIHIPFCKRKCHYCNFYSIASVKHHKSFLEATLKEISFRKDYLTDREIQTVYFGGGTPSCLMANDIKTILEEICKNYKCSSSSEITLEANPDDLNPALLKLYKEIGINRISIGIQSFHDEDLKYLNRIHTGNRAKDSILEVLDAGFDNVSIDLIYGIPTLSSKKWLHNLEQAVKLDVPHISAYSLTVEPKTALDVLIRKNLAKGTSELQGIEHFNILVQQMKDHGYEHYEISNFSIPGYHSRHNCNYWNGEFYLGLGPSAHSYNGLSRQWNIGNLTEYTSKVLQNECFYEIEELTPVQHYNEFIMVRLRTMWGCDLNEIRNRFGASVAMNFSFGAKKFIAEGKMEEHNGIYTLTIEGCLFADGIASDLFLEP